jgi:hypothetical protein
LALELFRLQFDSNAAYRALCSSGGITPSGVTQWNQIPAVPTAAFKEFDLSCLPAKDRSRVFHSSGTTGQQSSRHFHNERSLRLYETSVLAWFAERFGLSLASGSPASCSMLFLTPPGNKSPHSSLVHMFETIGRHWGEIFCAFVGTVSPKGNWLIDFEAVIKTIDNRCKDGKPLFLFGTAFSFIHVLDHFAGTGLRFQLPPGSRVLETGGYKGRSRAVPRTVLHSMIEQRFGVSPGQIICEYGMCELSSQAYAVGPLHAGSNISPRVFHFPLWARALIVSPETGLPVADGETGLIRVFDLANAWSVLGVQTEDLGIRRGNGFELIGRAEQIEPRGCSLMTA